VIEDMLHPVNYLSEFKLLCGQTLYRPQLLNHTSSGESFALVVQ